MRRLKSTLEYNMKIYSIIVVIALSLNVDFAAGDRLITKFDSIIKQFRTEFAKAVQSERVKMRAEIHAYNLEKKRIEAVSVKGDDIIQLNIGGQKMTTERSTLTQVNGSLLSIMFSGRWENKLKRDNDSRVFFDFNPNHFGLILNYLRAKKIETPNKRATYPKVPYEERKNFINLVIYLGLEKEFKTDTGDSFKLHSTGITIEEDGTVAVKRTRNEHKYVLGEDTYRGVVKHWRLKLESFHNNHWIYVGIVRADVSPSSDTSYNWSGSYGWALGNSGQVYKDGKVSHNSSLKNACKGGDTVELVLDCTTSKLTIVFPSGQALHNTLPSAATWRLHVNLYNVDDKIRIV